VNSMLHSFMSFSAILYCGPLLWFSCIIVSRSRPWISVVILLHCCCALFFRFILYCSSLFGFFIVMLVRRSFMSFLCIVIFTSFSAIVLCHDSFISFLSPCRRCIVCIFFLGCRSLGNSSASIPSCASSILKEEYQAWELPHDPL
jgi:hypothetical protein